MPQLLQVMWVESLPPSARSVRRVVDVIRLALWRDCLLQLLQVV